MSTQSVIAEVNGDHDIMYHQVSKYSPSGVRYLVARAFIHGEGGDNFTCSIRGEMNKCIIGFKYKFYGVFKEDGKYGRVFDFYAYEPIVSDYSTGLVDYLARHVDFLGKERSRNIVERFGKDTLDVIKTSPHRLVEVPGIGRSICTKISEYFLNEDIVDAAVYSRLHDFLSEMRPPRKIVKMLLKNFGAGAVDFVSENPYRLMDYPGIGWDRVDSFATGKLKISKKSNLRLMASVTEAMTRIQERGGTFAHIGELRSEAMDLSKQSIADELIDSMESIQMIKTVIHNNERYVSTYEMYMSEVSISENIVRLLGSAADLDFEIDCGRLEDEQVNAARMIERNGVCVVSGIPGSGKSFTTSEIIKSFHKNGIEDIIVVAPTGKAAKRAHELISAALPGVNIPCGTIHSTLGVQFSEEDSGVPMGDARINRGRRGYEFSRNSSNPLECSLLVADEFSMCDSALAASLLEAVPDGCRVLIVGDHKQLPSVGPGSVLKDMLSSEMSSCVFDKPRRNSGAIAFACYHINNGKKPRYFNEFMLEKGVNWVHLESDDDSRTLSEICRIHMDGVDRSKCKDAKSYEAELRRIKWQFQVISPEKKKKLGCISINEAISNCMHREKSDFNGVDYDGIVDESGDGVPYKVGDKVIRTRNGNEMMMVDKSRMHNEEYHDLLINSLGIDDYESFMDEVHDGDPRQTSINGKDYYLVKARLVNGDMGEIAFLTKVGYAKKIVVDFVSPDRRFILQDGDAKIMLAYAITCHKCQGSGFDNIIMPLSDFYWNPRTMSGLFNRSLVYTAFSRAITRLYTVGRISCLHDAISRNSSSERCTMLGKFLAEAGLS